jgi:dihydroflavonol-4-reductase
MILLTGGTGILGSHLLFRLAGEGNRIRAIYRDAQKIERVRRLFTYYAPEQADNLWSLIEWIACDVLDVVGLEDAMTGCDEVYHCAAAVSFRRRDFNKMMKINRRGTANIVNLALDLNVRKLAYVSSTSAVGKDPKQAGKPVVEINKWVQSPDTSGYAISKYSAEKEVWRGIEEGLNAVIINPSVILGPGSWEEGSLTIFRTIADGFKYYTSGSNAFVDVRDVSKALVQLMHSDISAERFLCTGTNIHFKDLFELMALEIGVRSPNRKAGKFLSGLAWRMAWLLSLFTGKRTLTKETAQSAQTETVYDSSKLVQALDFKFTPIEETVRNAVRGRLE